MVLFLPWFQGAIGMMGPTMPPWHALPVEILQIERNSPGRSSLIRDSVGGDRGVYRIVSERFFREYTPTDPLMAFGCFFLSVRK